MATRKLLCGIGVNDADYKVLDSAQYEKDGKTKTIFFFKCHYHSVWKGIFDRCYSSYRTTKYPSYEGCSVDPEWIYFSNFRKWMADQVESGMSDAGDKLYEEIIKECSVIHLESETQNTYTWMG